ncbi:Trk system potassium transporter TrkA [Halobium palmae]|uniref:Trk system potassium transporter TrkA n=1 Tax=Halobium palmae TaxID=1776492 RepID=A0ABD5RV56_9EURY
MRIIVVGAGEVGSNIAVSLSADHDVIVVDVEPETVEELTYSQDVLAVEGDGTSLDLLREVGVDSADLFIASTDDDETNLVACSTAKTLNDVFTIARIKNAKYLETWNRSERAFGVDFMVSVNLLTATDVVRIIGLPAALDVDPFSGGLVQMVEFEVTKDSEIAGGTIAESDRFEGLTFAALVHEGKVTIPRGETVIRPGDKIIVIGRPTSTREFSRVVAPLEAVEGIGDVVIAGGSEIGYHTARLLEERGLNPRLVERSPERARQLAELLPRTTVLEHDATDVEFLVAEHVNEADTVVAATDSDEKNLLISLLSKNIGVGRTVAIVNEGTYTELFEAVGIDVAISPREVTAEEIIRFSEEGSIENLSLIEGRQAEVLEVQVDEGSVLTGRAIREAASELPSQVVIGAITRDGTFIVPRGETVIEAGDHVVLFVATDVLSEVMGLV